MCVCVSQVAQELFEVMLMGVWISVQAEEVD
jgi:hypothetical protein